MKFIREILTILAGLIVVALTAALAAPYFIDWNGQRTRVEAQLSELTGAKVRVSGDIELRILPAPRLVLESVSVGGDGGFAMSARRVEAELAAMPLLRGQFHFMVARIEAPEISVVTAPGGDFNLPAWPAGAPGQVAFETIVITDGRLRISNAQNVPVLALEKIALDASAASLTGPWRGSGEASSGAQRFPFFFNTGVREADRLRLKLALEAAGDLPRSEFDGAIVFGDASRGAQFAFEGQAKIFGAFAPASGSSDPRLNVTWEASGPLRADAKSVTIEPLELRAGSEERTFNATGAARHVFGNPFAEIALETPRIDLDYLAGAKNRTGGMMSEFGDHLSALVNGGRSLPPLHLSLKSPAVTLGGELLSDVALSLDRQDARTANMRLAAGLPGRAALTLDGAIETGAAAQFKGRAKFDTRDVERFSQWLVYAFPALGEKLAGLPFARLEFDGDVDISATGLLARKVDIAADRSRLSGFLSATRAVGAERARIVVDMASPALDLDGIPDLTPLSRAASDIDYAIALDARAVRVARVGQGMIDAGRILLRLEQKNGETQIEQFDISGLGGASFSARGHAGEQNAQLDIKLNAERLVDLASLLQRIAPGVWSDALARRAVALSPAALTFSAQGERHEGALRLNRLTVEGSARGSKITGAFTPDAADPSVIAGKVSIANVQTPMLLRQLGFETVPLERLPDARIDIEASGSLANGFAARARASLAGTEIEWQGRAGALLPVANFRGPLRIASRDASPLLQVLALALPDASVRAAVDLSGELSASEGRVVLGGITGQALGSSVAGLLAFGADDAANAGARRALSGDLRIDRLSLESLAALIAGPRPPVRANAIWPDFRFAAAIADPPPARITVQAGVLNLPGGVDGESARFQLNLGTGVAEISDASIKLGNAHLRGRGTMRRDRGNVSVGGEIYYDGPVPAFGDFSASAQARLEFAGAGASYAAIVASLAGRGGLELSNLRIAAADDGALERVTAATLDMLDITEAKIATLLSQEFARNSASFQNVRFELALAGGQLSLTRAAAGGGPNLSASLDLRRLAADASLTFAAVAPEGWTGAPPEAAIRWLGTPGALRRSLVVSSLVNGLGARAIEREAARIEMLEFDARERAAFNRRARAHEFLQQRELEIAAFQQEQERRRQEDDARRKAQETAAKRAEAEREKRERERISPRQNAPSVAPPVAGPLQLTPQPAPAPPQAPVLNDPAAAGRY